MSKTTSSSVLESISDAIVDVTEKISPSVVRIGAGRWRGGTGTVSTKDEHIVTSNHDVGQMREVEIGFSDGTKSTANDVRRDEFSDIALSQSDHDNLKHAESDNNH